MNVIFVIIILFVLWIIYDRIREPFQLDPRPPNTGESYHRHSYTINGLPGKTPNRNYYIYAPSHPPPRGGYPYIVYYSFMKADGGLFPEDADTTGEGVAPLDDANECTLGEKCQSTSDIWLQMLFHLFLREGIAIVMTTMVQYDSYFYLECDTSTPETQENANDLYSICWNGNNPDLEYLQRMFNELYTNHLVNNNHMGIMGYSVGAQMVSRSYNEFPFLRTRPHLYAFPTIQVGIMISGGSLHCYQYCNADNKSHLRGPHQQLCQHQPSEYDPCYDEITRGCCPKGLTEPTFDTGRLPWTKHPPTVLAQTRTDNFADPNASVRYFETLKKNGVPTRLITGNGKNHNLFPSALVPILDFVSKYLQPFKNSICRSQTQTSTQVPSHYSS